MSSVLKDLLSECEYAIEEAIKIIEELPHEIKDNEEDVDNSERNAEALSMFKHLQITIRSKLFDTRQAKNRKRRKLNGRK